MVNPAARHELLADYSLEMTGKDVPGLIEASTVLAPGTRVNVTFLGNEDLAMRLAAAAAVAERGLRPVPHISARRIRDAQMLRKFLSGLQSQGTVERVFAVGGDPRTPEGPYEDSLALISSGLFEAHGVKEVSISGYPDGHPDISDEALWTALTKKAAALANQGLEGVIITQFGFDVAPVLDWAARVRDAGIDLPIRVGVPGPAGVKRLLAFAGRFGVASGAGIARKYGFSLGNLLGTAGPNRFIDELVERHDVRVHGDLRLHFYTFGGIPATATWVHEFNRPASREERSLDHTKPARSDR